MPGPMRRLMPPDYVSLSSSRLSKEEVPVAQFSPTRELDIAEIEEIVRLFGEIAKRFKRLVSRHRS